MSIAKMSEKIKYKFPGSSLQKAINSEYSIH